MGRTPATTPELIVLRGGGGRTGPGAVRLRPGTMWPELAVATLWSEAVIHLVAMPAHMREWALAGGFFGGIAAVEVALGIGLLARRTRGLWAMTTAVSLATMLVWGVSRIWGMPFGPAAFRPEAIGGADYICTCLEATTAVLGVIAALPGPGDVPPATRDRRLYLAAVAEIAVVAFCLTAVAVWAFRHEGGGMPRRPPAQHSAGAADLQGQ